jgi:phosphate transport system protein
MELHEQPAGATAAGAQRGYDRERGGVEVRVLVMGEVSQRMLVDAGIALQTLDIDRAREVIVADDHIDALGLEIEQRILELIERRQSSAGELRRLVTLVQTAHHLERVADSAVEIARLVLRADDHEPALVADLGAMLRRARSMVAMALRALHEKRRDLCLAVVRMGEQRDDVRSSLLASLAAEGRNGTSVSRLLWIDQAARLLERVGDHAIDIAEAVWSQLTSELPAGRHDSDAAAAGVERALATPIRPPATPRRHRRRTTPARAGAATGSPTRPDPNGVVRPQAG